MQSLAPLCTFALLYSTTLVISAPLPTFPSFFHLFFTHPSFSSSSSSSSSVLTLLPSPTVPPAGQEKVMADPL
ncbi:hypothetical protein E2C01_042396 [Portunus trituberculatus]|uniref:Uncharacterized protein n=1 Tax=Portunus trituberculatus TaxID=210409 RepID=A0A5B7FSZ3_PORTR|nr:hypothetical protein [Portunus trituberculatus]